MKRIYWLKSGYFYPADEPIPQELWESVEVTEAEWLKFKMAEIRAREVANPSAVSRCPNCNEITEATLAHYHFGTWGGCASLAAYAAPTRAPEPAKRYGDTALCAHLLLFIEQYLESPVTIVRGGEYAVLVCMTCGVTLTGKQLDAACDAAATKGGE